jgi:hypothetical protein
MSTAAGEGSIPSTPMPTSAVGVGTVPILSREEARDLILADPRPSYEELLSIVDKIDPRPAWYTSKRALEFHLGGVNVMDLHDKLAAWVMTDTPWGRGQGRKRKTSKRKRLRKRTYRRS